MNEVVQPGIWPDAEFEPCPSKTPCENCGHPMAGHWKETPDNFATACRECDCQHWLCRHGGVRT